MAHRSPDRAWGARERPRAQAPRRGDLVRLGRFQVRRVLQFHGRRGARRRPSSSSALVHPSRMSPDACMRRCTRSPQVAAPHGPAARAPRAAPPSPARPAGSCRLRPAHATIHARVPTLPTPTTFCAASRKSKRSNSRRVSGARLRRVAAPRARSAARAASRAGRNGRAAPEGSKAMRGSRSNARSGRRRARSCSRRPCRGGGAPARAEPRRPARAPAPPPRPRSRRAYQNHRRVRLRARTGRWPGGSFPPPPAGPAAPRPRSRPHISMLAAKRFTSHSHGPGAVSSKSLTSKTSLRSEAANPPKFAIWASPHACTRNPVEGVSRRGRPP